MNILCLLYLVVSILSEESMFKKPWQVIPIIEGLAPGTTYDPAYIDDSIDEDSSTVDMFIYQPNSNVEWTSDIRGTSVSIKPNVILNSQWSEVKMSYFDDDPYPDLLLISPVHPK